jgi:uncharacterized protein GlcG (DUF336 family)
MKLSLTITAAALVLMQPLFATAKNQKDNCVALPDYNTVKTALTKARTDNNGGLNLDMWATVVDRSGVVCTVVYTGNKADSQWPGSRVISAQKANTANAFSLKDLALSTANLYSAVQPGGPLFGLQESNPVDTKAAYAGNANEFGTKNDPMVGKRIGGVNVFGGGVALYNAKGEIVGALGVSGDTSCADHNIAWKLRSNLNLDYVPNGVAPTKNDQIVFDINSGKSNGGYGHPDCGGKAVETAKGLNPTKSIVR